MGFTGTSFIQTNSGNRSIGYFQRSLLHKEVKMSNVAKKRFFNFRVMTSYFFRFRIITLPCWCWRHSDSWILTPEFCFQNNVPPFGKAVFAVPEETIDCGSIKPGSLICEEWEQILLSRAAVMKVLLRSPHTSSILFTAVTFNRFRKRVDVSICRQKRGVLLRIRAKVHLMPKDVWRTIREKKRKWDSVEVVADFVGMKATT